MSGILDNKSRILDLVITREGKRQISSGDLVPKFISFSDGRSFYQFDANSGSSDASERIYFQAASRFEDQITMENNDSGQLVKYDGGPLMVQSQYLYKSILTGSKKGDIVLVSGSSEFASLSKDLLSGSLNNFKNLRLIGSDDPDDFSFSKEFKLSSEEIKFEITNKVPLNTNGTTTSKISESTPLFLDHRLSNKSNFKFLPPRNRSLVYTTPTGIQSIKKNMGDYADLREGYNLDLDNIVDYLAGKLVFSKNADNESNGMLSLRKRRAPKPVETIEFSETSAENNLVFQVFESNSQNGTIKKLDTIDYGDVRVRSSRGGGQPMISARLIFAGKIYLSEAGIPTFKNIFTIMLERK
jgi:hypothetical protein